MNLAPDQVKMFWRLWPQACRANGWTKERGLSAAEVDAKRKELLRACGFDSLTEVDRTDGFTRVKNKLLILIGVSVQAGKEDQDPTENTGRNHRYVIEKEILPCLALYEEDVTGYVATVIAGLTRHYKVDRPTRPPTLADLDTKPSFKKRASKWIKGPSQMLQALMTLSARLNDKRKAAGDSLHDMKRKAGVPCDCAEICRILRNSFEEVGVAEQPF
jgi:hypothetical protein